MAENQTTFELDLTNYVDKQGARVPEGDYLVRVADTEFGQSKASGMDKVTTFLEIIQGEYKGKTLRDTLSLSPQARFKIVGFMEAAGLATPRQKFTVNLQQWKGKVLNVTVKDREYDGNTYSNVSQYMPATLNSAPAAPDLALPPQEQAPAQPEAQQAPQTPQAAPQQPEAQAQVQANGQVDLANLNLG